MIALLPGFRKVAGAGTQCHIRTMRRIIPSRPNTYAGGGLDRSGHLRTADEWMDAALADANSRFVLFKDGRALLDLSGQSPRLVQAPRPEEDAPWVFLGRLDGVAIFAAEVAAAAGTFVDLHSVGGALPADEANILATGKGMLHWRAKNRFCAFCGGPNTPRRGGTVLHCESCGTEHFPRTDPAVIMLVTRGETVLLGQSHRFPADRNWYSTLAGFLEPGESLEDAVRREVFEEVGVRVGEVTYHSSQPWPFPASLMVGFYAEGLSEEIVLQEDEMRDAGWFSRAQIANRAALGFDLPGGYSIARRLIDDWLDAG